jgi:hypothetical protein
LTVARNDSRKIIASIDQDNSSAIELVANQPVKAVFAGIPVTLCSVAAIHPRADTRPPHPALCAPAGGPLPVKGKTQHTDERSEPQDHFELLSPRFNIELQLPAGVDSLVTPGQTGRVIFASERHSLGAWGWISLTSWIREKVQIATTAY